MPLAHPVDLHGQQLYLLPIGYFLHPLAEKWSELRKTLTERFDSALPQHLERALGNDHSGLKVVSPIEQDQKFSIVDVSEQLFGVISPPAKPEPEHIDGDSELLHFRSRGLPQRGGAAIASHYQVRADFDCLSIAPADLYASHAFGVPNQAHGLMPHA